MTLYRLRGKSINLHINFIYLEVSVGNMQGVSCSEILLPTVP